MTRWPPLPADVAPVPGRYTGDETMIDKAEIDRLINDLHDSPSAVRLTRRAATALTALQAQLAAAEALLGAAYRAALEDAAVTCQIEADRGQRSGEMRYHLGASSCRSAISALTPPADLAARLAKEAGQ